MQLAHMYYLQFSPLKSLAHAMQLPELMNILRKSKRYDSV